MKTVRYFYLFFILCFFTSTINSQIYLEEDFENKFPGGWEEIYISNGDSWGFKDGGREIEGENYPASSYEGNLNAIFSYMEERITKLVTPSIDLSEAVKAELQFAHAMFPYGDEKDELWIYYKAHPDSSWKILEHYSKETSKWIERKIQLPDSTYSDRYRIAFEGVTHGGAGVCIDAVKIVEKGVIPRKIESIDFHQASNDYIPSGSDNNSILRIDFNVTGNSGDLYLDSLSVKSLNTDDSDLKQNGVKLYATDDTTLSEKTLIGQSTDFTGQTAIFDDLHYSLPYGVTSVWVTYDVKKEINHDSHKNILDAKIESDAIKINNQTYPYDDKSPAGERVLHESLVYEDFEGEINWTLSGEFQVGVPQGLGSTNSSGSYSLDPDSNAVSGTKVLGTDLDSLGEHAGDYEPSIGYNAYYAASPSVNCEYYQDVSVNYYQWLNIELGDNSSVYLVRNQEDTSEVWSNNKYYFGGEWSFRRLNLGNQASRNSEVKVIFSFGPTDESGNYGGWNIDDFSITGDYIATDVGVADWLNPTEGCGLTDQETVKLVVKNYGAQDLTEPIPVAFSIDNGNTFIQDTIQQDIPVNDSITFTFSSKGAFGEPGLYKVLAETRVQEDEDTQNDRFSTQLFAYPNEDLPYSENFEQNDGYWQSLGTNKTWEYGTPKGDNLDSAASGDNVWMTQLDGPYPVNDSSFLESPCYNFSGLNRPIIELKICGDVEKQADGMKLQYSVDGKTWHDVDSASGNTWQWYNSKPKALNSPAWSHNSAEWKTVRQLLPEELTNHTSVKFRFLFQSDGFDSADEGYAIDDISIYEAPFDIGISDILAPVSQCELSDSQSVKLAVKNYGVRAVPANEEIHLKLKFNNESTIADTFKLNNKLEVGNTVSHVLSQVVNMSHAGDYELTAFTTVEENPAFYGNPDNDTIQKTVSVLGMPNYDLGPSIGTEQPDTLTLDAGAGYTGYQWHDGGPSTRTYDISSDGTYSVTVTNNEGCSATDSIVILPSNTDIGVVEVNNLSSACEYPSLHSVEIGVENFGALNKEVGDKLPVGYSINEDITVRDTITLEQILAPGDTTYFTFNSVDLTESKVYHFKLFSGYDGDINRKNDTLTKEIEVYGEPVVQLRADTLFTTRADTVRLNAGDGYQSYLWQDNSTDSIFDIQSKANAVYKVTVTDVHNCGQASDSVQIIADDFTIDNLTHPQNSCMLTEEEYPEVVINNNSQNSYSENTELYAGYKVIGEDADFNIDTINLPAELLPGKSYYHEFDASVDLSRSGVYEFKTFVTFDQDVKQVNDTLKTSVEVYGQPTVDLGYDTIYSTSPDTLVFNAGSEFKEYSWQDGSSDSIFEVSANHSKIYSVEVTAHHGCGTDMDSVVVVADDLAVSELVSPESSCSHSQAEQVEIRINNAGQDTLTPGQTISVGYAIDNHSPVIESFELKDSLFPGKSALYRFDNKIDISEEQRNSVKAFLAYNDVDSTNNTLDKHIFTYGYPQFSIGNDTIFTTEPDTLQFTVKSGYSSYRWQDSTMNDTFNVSKPTSEEYSVAVTDANGCTASDTVFVSAYDLGIVDIHSPNSACDLSSDETVQAQLKNFGADTIFSGESIPVGYQQDNQLTSEENITLQEPLFPDSSLIFSFSEKADFSEKKTYQFNVYTKFPGDAIRDNDSYNSEIDVYGPELELGPDTTVQSPSYEIDAGAGFSSYKWQDGSTGQTFIADAKDETNLYIVTVTNDFNCSASDSIFVWFDVFPDLEITEIREPQSGCKQDKPLPVVVRITNVGKVELPIESTPEMGYRLNQQNAVTENLQLNSALQPQNSMEINFKEKVQLYDDKVYDLKAYIHADADENSTNDTIMKEIDIHDPNPQLAGKDTLFLDSEDFPYNLAVGGQYADVLWQDGSTNNSFEVSEFGKYWVQVTDAYGCSGADTVVIAENQQVSVRSLQTPNYSISVYPNPVRQKLNLKIQARNHIDFRVSLISIEGVIYKMKKIKMKGADIISFPVNNYPSGYYQLRIESRKSYHVIPVVIR
jgi:hypothetical protein